MTMRNSDTCGRTAWAEIDLSALGYNYNIIKKKAKNRVVIPLVKANAYGHGLFGTSKFLSSKMKVKYLGVARVNEGAALRNAGIKTPVIVFNGFMKEEVKDIAGLGLEVSVFSAPQARALNAEAKRRRKKINVHFKINTGMNRLGRKPEEAEEFIKLIKSLKNLKLKSIYTHFACSDRRNPGITKGQVVKFLSAAAKRGKGLMLHAASSPAIARYPFALFGAVRPGIMLYGSWPDRSISRYAKVRPVMTLKTRVVNVIKLKKGECVSYGWTYRAKKNEKIAIIGIGYGDGFRRELSNKWYVKIRGIKAPVAGRVCMDLTAVRVRGNVKVGDEVLVFGKDRYGSIPVEDVADACKTIPYEIFTGISERVPRLYKGR